ncbi:MAG: PilT/PilU family type 4a pilus ATPase [Opitutales bacterium]|nr:PilT/PilU family type 4a pilus ATPase [Opitutales bacterium]NRA27717.1 PilT/PilU family type 4a pilus ATPase [Opitutales bacterium]
MEPVDLFNQVLGLAVENGASDIHIKTDKPAYFRLDGSLQPVEMDALDATTIREFIRSTVPAQFLDDWKQNAQVDYSYKHENVGRFRVNAFHQRSTPSIVFRHVKDTPPEFEDLSHDPATFKEMCSNKNGIVLVCGATGSGKSSTLAAMLNYINRNFDKHIVTLEDPIEFTYTDDKSVFNQREVGIDCPTFEMGLKAVLRQDPDVILVGEMRDKSTFETAIHAAETGHLVFGTLHASNCTQAIQRIFEFFTPEQQQSMRRQIAGALQAAVCQRLVPAIEGGRVPSCEILMVDGLARQTIEEGDFRKITAVIEAGEDLGSKTFNKDLYRLVKNGTISRNDGIAYSDNPKQLEMNLKGIFLSSGGIVG